MLLNFKAKLDESIYGFKKPENASGKLSNT